MSRISKTELRNCNMKIRKHTTLKIWAQKKGFRHATVIQFLNGHCCERQIGVAAEIIAALREDGYLDNEE